ncbi:MAG: HK97 gp10 family phage protein [Symbiobacteriaceae bacterium]|nr:HK97 gp10 family phage protein [Symbiobacteriaceae bacterium]
MSAGLEALAERYLKLSNGSDELLRSFMLEMGLRVLAKTKRLTPVDTGYLRNSWTLGQVERVGDTLQITISNPAEYASFVEYGHKRSRWKSGDTAIAPGDWVDGKFMATLSIMEVEREMPSHLHRYLSAWLAKNGG